MLPSCRPDRLRVDTKRPDAKGGLRLRRAYIIINAIPANTPPSTISVNRVPETIASPMNMPPVNSGKGRARLVN